MMRATAAVFALLLLTACDDGAKKAAVDDPFAGLDQAILGWRGEILKTHALCTNPAGGHACEAFEVACKAQRDFTAEDQARGVTAKVVAAITWNGFDPKQKQTQAGSDFAEFAKAGGAWTRTTHKPVNLSTCADL